MLQKNLNPKTEKTEGTGPITNLKRHTEDSKGTNDPQTQAAWISIRRQQPTWYKSLDIITPDGVVHEGWARVCGDNNNVYYVSNDPNINTIIEKITKWKYR